MGRKLVLNASPLTALGKLSALSLLERLCSDLVIPEGVVRELGEGSHADPARIWVDGAGARAVWRLEKIPPTVSSWDLGQGETEVISWAYLNPGYEAIVDDRAARNCALSLGIPVRGTIGILILAKKEGVLPQVKPLLNQLIASGFRIAPDLLQTAHKLADEG